MDLLIIVECAFFNLINTAIKGKSINIAKIQNTIWMLAFGIYLLNIFNFYDILFEVYIYSALYLLIFNVAYLLFNKKGNIKYLHIVNLKESIINARLNVRYVILISMVCWIISIPLLIKSIPILLVSGMPKLRYIIYSDFSIYSTFDMMFIMYFARPIYIIVLMITSLMVVTKSGNWKLLVVAFLNVINYTIMTSGRALMVDFFLYPIIALLMLYGGNIIEIIKRNKKIIIPIFILAIFATKIASLRVSRGYGVFGEAAVYYTGSMPYLSKLIEQGYVVSYSMPGRLVFDFIGDIIILIIKLFRIADLQLNSEIVSSITSNMLFISPSIKTNATSSLLLEFILDSGILGIVIGAIFLGLFSAYIEKRFYGEPNLLNGLLLLYITYNIFVSIQYYGFGKPFTGFTLFYILILFRKKNRNSRFFNRGVRRYNV